MANALLSALGVPLEPLTLESDEPSRVEIVEPGESGSTAGGPTVALEGSTRSAPSPVDGDSLLKSSTTPTASQEHPRRVLRALSVVVIVAIGLGGASYLGGRARREVSHDAAHPLITQSDTPSLARVEVTPPPPRDIDLPSPQIVLETKTPSVIPVPSPPTAPTP